MLALFSNYFTKLGSFRKSSYFLVFKNFIIGHRHLIYCFFPQEKPNSSPPLGYSLILAYCSSNEEVVSV